MIFDTGSANLWVPNKKPFLTKHSLYDHTKSSTYKPNGTKFAIQYGSGPVSGYYSRDTFSIDTMAVPDYLFAEVNTTKGLGIAYYLAKFDGILKQASVNTVAVGSNPLTKTVFRDMLKAMPTEFLRNKKKMRFLTSVDAEIDYRDTTNSREAALGDRYLAEDGPVAYSGIPIMDVPVFPEGLGVGANETNVLLTDPKNINVGIWRKVTMETDKDISAGVLIIVATLRFDVRFAEKRATVRADGITVS